MKQLFHIENDSEENGQQILSLRFGKQHGSFSVSNKSGTALYELGYCSVSSWDESELITFFSAYPSLQHTFYKIHCAYDFAESVLTPSAVYTAESAGLLLDTAGAHGDNINVISELITEWQLYNVYAAPKEIQVFINQKFPSARFWHQHSVNIKHSNAAGKDNTLLVDIRKEDFTVIASASNKILLAQTFEYTTPDDVLYYLLKTAQRFSLSQQEVQLSLSGLVDKQSALYKELYQYFINIEFRDADWGIQGEYPAHFFTSLNDLAKCAS